MDKGQLASAGLASALDSAIALGKEDRTQFIGGSDIAAILGVDPYRTRLQVYEEKLNLVPSFEGNAHTKRGIKLEAFAAEEYTERTGLKMQRVNRRLVHPGFPFLTARVDRRILGGTGKLAEIKCPSLGSFSKIKREGLHEGYIVQFQHYLGLTGPELAQANGLYAESGEWIIFCADQWDLISFPVEPDSKLIADMWERAIAFWNEHIVKRVPPPVEDRDEERLEIRRAEGEVAVYDMARDPAFIEAMDLLRDARQLAAETELLGDEAKARVKEIVGDRFGVFLGNDVRLSYTQAKGRASFDKKALAGAKPLDRMKVQEAVLAYAESRAMPSTEVMYLQSMLANTTLDLGQFETKGAPYPIMRPTFYGEK